MEVRKSSAAQLTCRLVAGVGWVCFVFFRLLSPHVPPLSFCCSPLSLLLQRSLFTPPTSLVKSLPWRSTSCTSWLVSTPTPGKILHLRRVSPSPSEAAGASLSGETRVINERRGDVEREPLGCFFLQRSRHLQATA